MIASTWSSDSSPSSTCLNKGSFLGNSSKRATVPFHRFCWCPVAYKMKPRHHGIIHRDILATGAQLVSPIAGPHAPLSCSFLIQCFPNQSSVPCVHCPRCPPALLSFFAKTQAPMCVLCSAFPTCPGELLEAVNGLTVLDSHFYSAFMLL